MWIVGYSVIILVYLSAIVWVLLYTYPWQCKICGLPGYPYGCRGHSEPIADIELVHSMLWPYLPKDCTVLAFPKTKGIEVYAADGITILGVVNLRDRILTLNWVETPKPRFYDQTDTPQVKKDRVASWNIADPNSTSQLVKKITELRNV